MLPLQSCRRTTTLKSTRPFTESIKWERRPYVSNSLRDLQCTSNCWVSTFSYACAIADIIRHFAHVKVIVMGDVSYGACCVDDYSAKRLGADFMVHYGHSCLIPIQVTQIPVLYIFVELKINVDHLVKSILANVPDDQRIALLGTIQFSQAIHQAAAALKPHYPEVIIPQEKPLSRGEVLGCTSPFMPTTDCMIFIADGRFHVEVCVCSNNAEE